MSETAAKHLVTRVPTAHGDELARDLLARLCGQSYDAADGVYVVDADARLLGVIPWTRLLGARPDARADTLLHGPPLGVSPDSDQEQVAGMALRQGVVTVPVLDAQGILLGAVPALALLEILHREHVEDLHLLAGIARESDQARESIESPPVRRARHRLPWLLVGFTGSMLAALVMSRFERMLEANLAVAFFIPTIVYIADAIGTQTETIVVRGLSLSPQPFGRVLRSELRTGIWIGSTLGLLAVPVVGLAFDDFRLGASVGIAVAAAGTAATTIGLALPWLLTRMGKDPALGSGPLATVIQDVLSLLIYFAVASALMPG